ncbi:MAG: hypothetical protein NTY74_07455 [Ignavibacteriae bacterium]|nr:hypothetical protein [Ignavibacteriota bacterium]
MAKITNASFGNISGKVGDFVFRQRNGKTIIASRPQIFLPDQSSAAKARRKRFGLSAKFSSCLAQNPFLKELWLNSEPKGSGTGKGNAFTKISKHIYPNIMPDDIAEEINITPSFPGFELSLNKTSVSFDSISAEINPVPDSEQQSWQCYKKASQIHTGAFLFLSDKIDERKDDYKFYNLLTETLPFNPSVKTKISIPVYGILSALMEIYAKYRLFLVFFALDDSGNLVAFSNTIDTTHRNPKYL